MSIDIRPATPADVPVLVSLVEQYWTFEEIDGFDAERIGTVLRGLLAAVESACREAGCTNIALQLGRENESARRFYKRKGYSERHGYELLDKDLD